MVKKIIIKKLPSNFFIPKTRFNGRIFVILVAFLFVLTGANALTLSTDKAETCATDTSIFQFTVSNAGNFDNSYTVSFSDSAGKWAIAAPSGFNLKPGRSETVYVYVTPSISANPGVYPLKITLSSLAGTDAATATITVKDCHSASLTTNASTTEVCSATEALYPLMLQNTGKYTENFALSITGVPAKWSTLSEELVKLEAGQAKNIMVYSTPPADQTGKFALTVTAASQNSRALASADLKLASTGCYGFSATSDTNYVSFCENSEAKIPFAVENKGSVDNSYTMSVEGPVWSTMENEKLDIPAGQAKFTNVVLFPGYGVAGDFKINVVTTPKTGDVQEQTILANVRSCHDLSLKLASVEDTICPQTSKAYAVSLVNNGEFSEKYSLTVTGGSLASIDKDFVELGAGNSTEFNLLINPKDNPAETRTIVVRAEAQEPSHASANAELKLAIAPMSSCYGVQATTAITKVHVAVGEPAVVPIIIENKGLENSTYNLDVSGTGAQFVQLNPASLELNGKSAKTIYAYVAVPEQTAEDSYKVTVSARLADGAVSSATTFDIILGKAAAPAEEEKPLAAETPKERLIAIKNRIVTFFESIGDKIRSIHLPEINLAKFGAKEAPETGGAEIVELTENETAENIMAENATNITEENITVEENQTQENITVENVTVEANKTTENLTVSENLTEGQNLTQEITPEEQNIIPKANLTAEENLTEELPENISAFLSPEAAAKLSGNETGKTEETGKESPLSKLNLPKLSIPEISIPSLGFIKDFLMQSTYYIPNWLFIIAVIVIVALLSYGLRKKDFAKKFNEFLEEDAETPAAEKKPGEEKSLAQDKADKSANLRHTDAQDILDEIGGKEKKKPAVKKKKKE